VCVFVHQQIPDSRLFVVAAFVVVSWGQIYEYRLYRMCVDIMALAFAFAFAVALALPLNCFSAHQLYYALIIDALIHDSATLRPQVDRTLVARHQLNCVNLLMDLCNAAKVFLGFVYQLLVLPAICHVDYTAQNTCLIAKD